MAKKEGTSIDEKLDVIIHHLEKLDSRDRLRTWGGFVKSLIGFIPIIILVWSIWYFYEHGDELLMKITQHAAQQAAEMTRVQGGDMVEQIKLMFPDAGL